jgi:hypothetical protein
MFFSILRLNFNSLGGTVPEMQIQLQKSFVGGQTATLARMHEVPQ